VTPLVVATTGALLFTRYPLTRTAYADVQARLERRRGEKAAR
jgi:Na+/melibiose symporter-like transporter